MRASRGVARTTYRTGRTTYRAGKAVSRGRVPNLGVRVGVAGVGVRVGTRGIKVRTPVARASIGSGGIRLTAGKPGIAHLTVNPIKPSATVGVGPIRLNASRHPGLGAKVGLVGVGVTSEPLLVSYIGGSRFSMPGSYVASDSRWYEEIDEQWRREYQRRPPSFVASLHDVISRVEDEARHQPWLPISSLERPTVGISQLSSEELHQIRKASRSEAFKNFKFWKFWSIGRILQDGSELASQRARTEIEARQTEADLLQSLVDTSFKKWTDGNVFARALVLQATFDAEECPAYVLNVSEDQAVILVIGPDLDDIHPEKPAFTNGGAATVKKKTKAERTSVHTDLVIAAALGAGNILARRLNGNPKIRLLVALRSDTASSMSELPVVADLDCTLSDLAETTGPHCNASRRSRANSLVTSNFLKKPKFLGAYVGSDGVAQNEEPAFLVDVTSGNDLKEATFWIELHQAIELMEDQGKVASDNLQSSATFEAQYRETVPTLDSSIGLLGEEFDTSRRDELRQSSTELMERRLLEIAKQAELATASGDRAAVRTTISDLTSEIPDVREGADDETELVLLELFDALVVMASDEEIERLNRVIHSAHRSVIGRCSPVLRDIQEHRSIKNQIISLVSEGTDVLQSTIPAKLGRDASVVRRICWYLDHFDFIIRTRKGSSYILTIPETQT